MITDHKWAVNQMDTKNANAVHSDMLNHRINWDRSKVISREKKWKERKIKEDIHLQFRLNQGTRPTESHLGVLIRGIK